MKRMAKVTNGLILMCSMASGFHASAADLPYVNFENHPIHALDISPNQSTMAVAHTADQRVQLFDVRSGTPVAMGAVVVGIDPVSVRFRSNNELWVVNHISDSISVIDLSKRRVMETIATRDEPFDVVFANNRAFVTCSQVNQVMVLDLNNRQSAPQWIKIQGEDPRALAVSLDGRSVYAAVFESGNGSTLLAGGLADNIIALPNVVSDPRGPYAGQNPPPNAGTAFDPPLHPAATPPRVGLIVRKDGNGRWRDDNQKDWSEFVSGPLAGASGRVQGWDLPDRDLAVIDSDTLSVRYVSRLMNIGMALAVHPTSGALSLIGTDADNQIRFEPKLNGRFVKSKLAMIDANLNVTQNLDLNPHLDYQQASIPQSQRVSSIAEPRAIAWQTDGLRGFIAGLGSNNVQIINAQGQRVGVPIAVGQGPIALTLHEATQRLYVWNHFDASLSVLDTNSNRELKRVAVFNPLPQSIRAGRPFLYDAHRTSGLGQAACASCHVDARMDRLAWDLGDPSAAPQVFDQNCQTTFTAPGLNTRPCENFHAMKGPMTTQTLQDIIGHEPFHWRGDRAGIEAFNPAFTHLLGDDAMLSASEMQSFENFLASISFPPNPYRSIDNTLPEQLNLEGHYTSGRFGMPGLPLGTGNAKRGLELYNTGLLDTVFQCGSCHSLPTGMAVNGPLLLGALNFSVGGLRLPMGPMGENHLGIVSTDGSTNVSIKVPHLRNQYDKVGFHLNRTDSTAGFGYLHDGSVDSIANFVSARAFSVRSNQDTADLVALMLAFAGSEFTGTSAALGAPAPLSRDAHAGVGQQLTVTSAPSLDTAKHNLFMALARARKVDLVVRVGSLGYFFDATSDRFLGSDDSTPLSESALLNQASAESIQTWSLVPLGLGRRLGLDRDGDGIFDAKEIAQGSNPADAAATAPRLSTGLWFNPARSGHGLDVHYAGSNMVVTWYTYDNEANPTWYQAVAAISTQWSATLNRYTRDPNNNTLTGQAVGEIKLNLIDAQRARFEWRMGEASGIENMVPLTQSNEPTLYDRKGLWYDANEPGWGLSLYSEAEVSVAVLYFYDANQQPRWVLGQGAQSATQTLNLLSFKGFCPSCALVPTTFSTVGTIDLDYTNELTRAAVNVQQNTPAATWQRGMRGFTALSSPALRPAAL